MRALHFCGGNGIHTAGVASSKLALPTKNSFYIKGLRGFLREPFLFGIKKYEILLEIFTALGSPCRTESFLTWSLLTIPGEQTAMDVPEWWIQELFGAL